MKYRGIDPPEHGIHLVGDEWSEPTCCQRHHDAWDDHQMDLYMERHERRKRAELAATTQPIPTRSQNEVGPDSSDLGGSGGDDG